MTVKDRKPFFAVMYFRTINSFRVVPTPGPAHAWWYSHTCSRYEEMAAIFVASKF
jgi:hypothetical protein